ncbi:MAG: YceD family protein [Azoarcus sp.]|jgi:uncharacterized protein|nr:YceD family protein [Azoarcus sp.]
MSEQGIAGLAAGRIADVFRFAAERRALAGEIAVSLFERLADQLVDSEGAVRWRLAGSFDAEGRPRLYLEASGRLTLRCQRCLGRLAWELTVAAALLPVRAGQALPEDELENDEVDVVEVDGDGEVDVLSLIEDEILLALPIVPRHEDCAAPRPTETDGDGASRGESPFAALAGLRGNSG